MHKVLWAAFTVAAAGLLHAEEPPTAGNGWVVLPVDEYRSLHDKAYPSPPDPGEPPVAVAVTRIDYDLRVDRDVASGVATLTLDVMKDGWVQVPLAGLAVRAARLDGKPVALLDGKAKSGVPELVLSRAGRKVLSLDVAVPLSSRAGTASFSLPVVGAAVARANVVVPGDGLDVHLAGALLRESANVKNETHWTADGSGSGPMTFSWQKKVEDHRAALPLRLRGAVTQTVGLGEDSAQVQAEVRLDVTHGLAPSVTLSVPDGLTINQVSGANVADWDVRKGALLVTFLEPVEASETLTVAGEARCPREGKIGIPLLRLQDAERETGGVAVEVLGAGEITDRDARGVDAADAKDLGGAIAERDSPLVVAFRYRAQESRSPRSLDVTVSRYTPQAVLLAMAEEARYDALLTDDGKVLVRGRYAVRNNQQSFLVVKLPVGATLWSASLSGQPIRPGRSAEGALLVPLEKGRAGEETQAFAVEILYLDRAPAWTREGRVDLILPALDMPVSRTSAILYRSPRYRVTLEPGAFREQPYHDPLSPALRASPAAREAGSDLKKEEKQKTLQALADRVQQVAGRGRSVSGALPMSIPFPAAGDVLFLVSELTPENESPRIAMAYKQKKGGRS